MVSNRRQVLLAAAAATALGIPHLRARANKTWLIGQSAPQASVLGAVSLETTAGARLYFDQLNSKGGVHGRPIQLMSLDDGQDPKRTAENTQQLIDKGALALTLYRSTPSIAAALPLAAKADVAFIGAQTGPTILYEPAQAEVFNTRSRYKDEVVRAVKFFADLGFRRVGALVAADAFGHDVMAGLLPGIEAANAELVAQPTIDNRSADVSQQLQVLRKADPHVVLLICNAKAAAEFVKAAKNASMRATFVALSNTSSSSFVKDLGAAARGVVVTQVVPTPYSSRVRVVSDFRQAVEQQGALAPALSHAALQGYITAKFIHELIRRAGPGADRELLRQGSLANGSFDLGDFALNFTPQNRQGSRLAELTVIGSDGRFMY
jgi:branched-chain amino acid transport system substrate-binding protein